MFVILLAVVGLTLSASFDSQSGGFGQAQGNGFGQPVNGNNDAGFNNNNNNNNPSPINQNGGFNGGMNGDGSQPLPINQNNGFGDQQNQGGFNGNNNGGFNGGDFNGQNNGFNNGSEQADWEAKLEQLKSQLESLRNGFVNFWNQLIQQQKAAIIGANWRRGRADVTAFKRPCRDIEKHISDKTNAYNNMHQDRRAVVAAQAELEAKESLLLLVEGRVRRLAVAEQQLALQTWRAAYASAYIAGRPFEEPPSAEFSDKYDLGDGLPTAINGFDKAKFNTYIDMDIVDLDKVAKELQGTIIPAAQKDVLAATAKRTESEKLYYLIAMRTRAIGVTAAATTIALRAKCADEASFTPVKGVDILTKKESVYDEPSDGSTAITDSKKIEKKEQEEDERPPQPRTPRRAHLNCICCAFDFVKCCD
ncbi:unnamed protein product, partial [Mesorhabditis spiculigera]